MNASDPHFKILAESNRFIIGHAFEDGYLIDKWSRKNIHLGDMYGDPSIGLISTNEEWCVLAGSELIIWRQSRNIHKINDADLSYVVRIKQVGPSKIHLLTEPSTTNKWLLWSFDVNTNQKQKLRDIEESDLDGLVW